MIKTLSFLSGDVLIGKMNYDGDLEDAFFVTVIQHPETGERMATFRPAARGRESQTIERSEVLQLMSKAAAFGPSEAAPGLIRAYESFMADEECVRGCILRYTTECGPSGEFLKEFMKDDGPPQACTVKHEGNLIKGIFAPEISDL